MCARLDVGASCSGTAGGFHLQDSASVARARPVLCTRLHRGQRVVIAAAWRDSRITPELLSSAGDSSDTESGQSASTTSARKPRKPHVNRGRPLGPQNPEHLNSRIKSLKQTLMAQTPERRRKRCSICGEIGHNKLSCPSATDAMPRKNTVTCSQCGQPGHNSRSCPVKPRSTTVTCSQCGRDGHNCRTCPMRAKTKKGSKAASNSTNSISKVRPFSTLSQPSARLPATQRMHAHSSCAAHS